MMARCCCYWLRFRNTRLHLFLLLFLLFLNCVPWLRKKWAQDSQSETSNQRMVVWRKKKKWFRYKETNETLSSRWNRKSTAPTLQQQQKMKGNGKSALLLRQRRLQPPFSPSSLPSSRLSCGVKTQPPAWKKKVKSRCSTTRTTM